MNIPSNSCHPATREEWRAWLAENHGRKEGVWLIRYKKATGKPYIGYDASVEEAICFGWIDSRVNKLDEARSMLYFAPRKKGSGWSRVNKERVERLVEQGKLAPSGLAKIRAAREDGSWNALDEIENLFVPEDLANAFARYPESFKYWESFPRSVKRSILEWIAGAKREETRRRRVEDTARMAQINERSRPCLPNTRR